MSVIDGEKVSGGRFGCLLGGVQGGATALRNSALWWALGLIAVTVISTITVIGTGLALYSVWPEILSVGKARDCRECLIVRRQLWSDWSRARMREIEVAEKELGRKVERFYLQDTPCDLERQVCGAPLEFGPSTRRLRPVAVVYYVGDLNCGSIKLRVETDKEGAEPGEYFSDVAGWFGGEEPDSWKPKIVSVREWEEDDSWYQRVQIFPERIEGGCSDQWFWSGHVDLWYITED